MITVRFKTALFLLSVLLNAHAVFAKRPYRNSVHQQPVASQEQQDINAATAASIAAHQERQKNMQQEEARVIAESMRTYNQEQEDNNTDEALVESVQTHQQEELARTEFEHAVAQSITAIEQSIAAAQMNEHLGENGAIKTPALKDRIKVWISNKWENTKFYAYLAKYYVTDSTSRLWAKTKNGCKRGLIATQLAFKKLWAKINLKSSQVQPAKTTTA